MMRWHQRMRPTLDIDDEVLAVVKHMAAARRITAGKLLSELARQVLTEPRQDDAEEPASDSPPLAGFAPISKRKGVVSRELIQRLLDEQ